MAGVVTVSRVIPAPVAEVWRVFTDLPARRRWLADVQSVEVLTPQPLTPAVLEPGVRWRETRGTHAGPPVTEELVVVAVDAGRSCTVALAGNPAGSRLTYTFEPVSVGHHRGSTEVCISAERHPRGFGNRLLSFFLAGFAARTAEGALRAELDALAAACLAGWSDQHLECPAA